MNSQREKEELTFVIAGGKYSLICGTGANVPYLPSLVQKDILINDVILIIKVNYVNLKEKQRERHLLRMSYNSVCTSMSRDESLKAQFD